MKKLIVCFIIFIMLCNSSLFAMAASFDVSQMASKLNSLGVLDNVDAGDFKGQVKRADMVKYVIKLIIGRIHIQQI